MAERNLIIERISVVSDTLESFCVLCDHSPPFQGGVAAPSNQKIPFFSGADGVVSKFKQIRCASRHRKVATRLS